MAMLPSRGLPATGRTVRHAVWGAAVSPGARRALSSKRLPAAPGSIEWQLAGPGLRLQRRRPDVLRRTILPNARFASTAAPVASPSTLQQPQDNPLVAGSPSEFDTSPVVTSTSVDELTFGAQMGAGNMSEHIGYLSELGLNFGWGPTTIMQSLYEAVHVWSGTPWWGSILIASALYRGVILVYPMLQQSDQAARMKAVAPYLKEISQRKTEAQQSGDQAKMMATLQEVKALNRSAGIKYSKQFTPIIVQAMLGYGTFHFMREAASLPVPGLETGGFAWLHDLTIPDPYYILPATLIFTMHWMIKKGAAGSSEFAPATDPNAATGHLKGLMMYGFPAIAGGFMLWMPACLQLSFVSTSIIGFVQGRLLMRPAVRNALGLWPMESAPSPLNGTTQEQHANSVSTAAKPKAAPRQLRQQAQTSRQTMAGYEAPSMPSPYASTTREGSPAVKSSMLGLSGVKKWWEGLKEETMSKVGMGSKKGARGKKFTRDAEAYEKRRRREIEEGARYRREEKY